MARPLQLEPEERAALWAQVAEAIEAYAREVDDLPVAPRLDPAALRARLSEIDFRRPMEPAARAQGQVRFLQPTDRRRPPALRASGPT